MPTVSEAWTFTGEVRISEGNLKPPRPRSELKQEVLASYFIPPMAWRVWDAFQTLLPGASAADDLGLIGGTWATGTPSIQTYDVKNAGAVTLYARTMIQLPPEYDTAETVELRVHAGMLTTIASTSATVDFEVYKTNEESLVSGSDLCATAAQSINSLTFADKEFVITATSLVPGDMLDVRMTIAVSDAATATAVKACVGSAELLCDIRG